MDLSLLCGSHCEEVETQEIERRRAPAPVSRRGRRRTRRRPVPIRPLLLWSRPEAEEATLHVRSAESTPARYQLLHAESSRGKRSVLRDISSIGSMAWQALHRGLGERGMLLPFPVGCNGFCRLPFNAWQRRMGRDAH